MPCNVGGQRLVDFQSALNQMKIIVSFLVRDVRKLILVLLQHLLFRLNNKKNKTRSSFELLVIVAPTVQEKSQWAIVYVIKRQTLGLFSIMLFPLVVAHFCSADSEGCERFGVLSFYDWSPNK